MMAPIPELTSVTDGIARARVNHPELWNRLHDMERWTVYTDGSAPIVNPGGVIGFSTVFVLDATTAFEVSGGVAARTADPPTSNNRAEIAGAIAILELLYRSHQEKLPLPQEVEIVCDSQYVVNCAQGKWKKHKNRDLWTRFDQLASVARAQKVKVIYRWTRAHVGTEWNERADVLAKEAALSMNDPAALPSAEHEMDADLASPTPLAPQHYHLRLFAVMTGRNRAEGYYEMRTSEGTHVETVPVANVITLDEAEYHLLNNALSELLTTLDRDGRSPTEFKLQVESSRDLMLKQIQGIYGVKAERLIPLHGKTRQLMRKFGGVTWTMGNKTGLKSLCPS